MVATSIRSVVKAEIGNTKSRILPSLLNFELVRQFRLLAFTGWAGSTVVSLNTQFVNFLMIVQTNAAPAIIPKDIRTVSDFISKKSFKEILYDSNGHATHIKIFSKEEKCQRERTYSSCSKKKKTHLNKDGYFASWYYDLQPMLCKA